MDEYLDPRFEELKVLSRKFHYATRQIVILNNKIIDLQARYTRAVKVNNKAFRYTLRLQLETTEGIRNMYFEYVRKKADELDDLQEELIDEGLMSDTEVDFEMNADNQ